MVPVKPSFLPPRQACVRIPSAFHKTPVSIRCPGILTVILVWHIALSCIGGFFFIIPSSAPLQNHTFQKRQPPFFTEGCHPQFMGQSGLLLGCIASPLGCLGRCWLRGCTCAFSSDVSCCSFRQRDYLFYFSIL